MGFKKVSLQICAHTDDWMVFRGEVAYADLMDKETKCVFISLCAGEGGPGANTRNRSQAMELGTVDALSAITWSGSNYEAVVINGKQIAKYSCDLKGVSEPPWVAYFLRIPDGPGDWNKWDNLEDIKDYPGPRDGHKSATKEDVTSKDGWATYENWGVLVQTLADIVSKESDVGALWSIHYPDNDKGPNVEDSFDHYAVAYAVRDCLKLLTITGPLYEQWLWIGYCACTLGEKGSPTNLPWIKKLTGDELIDKNELFDCWHAASENRIEQSGEPLIPDYLFLQVRNTYGAWSGLSKHITRTS